MSEQEKAVWEAIGQVLDEVGDVDVKAGLAWLSEADKQRVARAAIESVTAAMSDAAVAERERCAKIAEQAGPELGGEIYAAEAVANTIAARIREGKP